MAHDKPFTTDASREAIKRGEDKACSPSWCEPRNEPNMAERTLLHVANERDRYRQALEKILQFDETKGGLMRSIAKSALEG